MTEWLPACLEDLAWFQKGRKVNTSPSSRDGFIPYLGASALERGPTQYADPTNAVVATTNDVLMLWDGERSGLVGRSHDGVVGSTVMKLTPRERTDGGFLFHALTRRFEWIQARRTGTGIPHVPKDLGSYLQLLVPPRWEEQVLVAEILDKVDQATRHTDQLIAKLQLVKQGLLHALLTGGIDENGELRDPDRQSERFCESLLGLIPDSWTVGRLRGFVDRIDAGWSPACVERPPTTGEWGILKVSAVTSGHYLAAEAKALPQALSPRPRIEVSSGDVILARANGVNRPGFIGGSGV